MESEGEIESLMIFEHRFPIAACRSIIKILGYIICRRNNIVESYCQVNDFLLTDAEKATLQAQGSWYHIDFHQKMYCLGKRICIAR